jgi:capsular polysaccharide biosynthesis protein
MSKKYIRLFFSRIWLLFLLLVVSSGAAYVAHKNSYEPIYEARIKIMIVIDDIYANAINIFDSIRSSQMAVVDVSQIATSEEVLSEVEKECGISRQILEDSITINAIPNSRIIEGIIQTYSPELALMLLQSLDKNLYAKLDEFDGITYKVLNRPYTNGTPINGNNYLIITGLAALGGILFGGLINIVIGESGLFKKSITSINDLFENENILPVPTLKKAKIEEVRI